MSLRWLLPQATPDVIRFTVTPTASAKTVTLENLTAPCNCFIDWCDGERSAQIISATSVSHTYADTAPRQITIHGVLGGFWNSTAISVGKTLVTSIDEINSRSLVSLVHTFRGCTGVATLPAILDAPNVTDFSYAFYQCRSIASALPALWLSHQNAAHASCFTDCFKSLYGQYGTGCSVREYVAAVAAQTYYQHYGKSGCPSSTYHAGSSKKYYYDVYGGYSRCPHGDSAANRSVCSNCGAVGHSSKFPGCGAGKYVSAPSYMDSCWNCNQTCLHSNQVSPCNYSACSKVYSPASSAYYTCGHFGGNCKESGCTRTYISGQSAYYKCKKSNAACPTTNCPYPYANEADYNAARVAGWA